MSHRWPVVLVATAFFLLALTYGIVTPLFESLDEVWHYPFVWHLARTGQLPVQDPADVQLWRQEGSQPPLYYALAAALTAPLPAGDLPALIYRNPHADLGLVTADGNVNMIVHTAQEAWPWRGTALAVHVVRLFSALLGTGTVLAVYALGRALWPERPAYALLAMSFVAFNPMFLFVAGSVNNDNLIIFLASLALWRLVLWVGGGSRQQPDEPSLWRFVGLGLLAGLGALSKLSGLGLLGLTGLTLLWAGWQRRSWRTAILGNSVVGLLTGLIAGWWYWRNLALYGDWSGTENMVAMMGPRPATPTVGQLLAEAPGFFRSFWGMFGGFSVPMPSPVYWLLNLMLLIGLVGLAVAWPAGRAEALPPRLRRAWPVLAGWIVLMITGLIQWTSRTTASQGRLLFPALAAVAALWAAGWLALVPRRLQALPAVALFVLAVWVPWGVIAPVYARPTPLAALPPSAAPLGVTFGDAVRLLAFESQASTVQPGDSLPLTLYWRGERPTDIDYTVFIHLVDEYDLILAQRDVFHGPGVYPTSQWTVGQQFGDTYVLRLPNTAFAPAQARFVVGLYDRRTGARLPASSGGDSLEFGSIRIAPKPGQLPNPQALLFEDDIALVGYALDRRQVSGGESLTLTLYWGARGTPSQNYKVFVHLVDGNEARIAQHDSEPQSGAAPTSSWQEGQVIVDEHPLTLAPDAPPGAYQLVVGLYEGDTGRRLQLLRDGRTPQQAVSVPLGRVRVVPP
ncbi:MAG: ArnT family glycosyltransferase [Anaerolineae bacterium]